MAMDYDLWLRLAKISTPVWVDSSWVYFREHFGQKTGLGNVHRQLREILEIHKRLGLPLQARLTIRRRKLYYMARGYLRRLVTRALALPCFTLVGWLV